MTTPGRARTVTSIFGSSVRGMKSMLTMPRPNISLAVPARSFSGTFAREKCQSLGSSCFMSAPARAMLISKKIKRKRALRNGQNHPAVIARYPSSAPVGIGSLGRLAPAHGLAGTATSEYSNQLSKQVMHDNVLHPFGETRMHRSNTRRQFLAGATAGTGFLALPSCAHRRQAGRVPRVGYLKAPASRP